MKKTGANATGLWFIDRLVGVELHAAARCRGWSTASWCHWSTARDWRTAGFRSRTAWFTVAAAEAFFEHPGKQPATWFAAWITAWFRFTAWLWRTAYRCRFAASWSWSTTWLRLRAAWFATIRLGLETAKQAGFDRLRSHETAQYSHGQQRKNTSH